MRTIIYVDGFNLYFRMLEKRPALKWLNVKILDEKLLNQTNIVTGVRYYTARVSGRVDPTAPARHQLYLDALQTVPEISLHMGAFMPSEKFAGLVKPPDFRPKIDLPLTDWPSRLRNASFQIFSTANPARLNFYSCLRDPAHLVHIGRDRQLGLHIALIDTYAGVFVALGDCRTCGSDKHAYGNDTEAHKIVEFTHDAHLIGCQ